MDGGSSDGTLEMINAIPRDVIVLRDVRGGILYKRAVSFGQINSKDNR